MEKIDELKNSLMELNSKFDGLHDELFNIIMDDLEGLEKISASISITRPFLTALKPLYAFSVLTASVAKLGVKI